MANKRPPISFPELEARGRHAILRSAEEVQAEEALLREEPESQDDAIPESQQSSNPANQHAGKTVRQQTSRPESQPASEPENQPASEPENQLPIEESGGAKVKVTYRLSPEAFDAIYEAKQLLRRRRIKASLEEIAEQAIVAACQELLDNPGNSMLERQLSRKM
jgi:hypothetical protein